MPLTDYEKNGKYTYADYKTWPDNERWELINGVAFSMSPAPKRNHQRVSIALSTQIFTALEGKPCEAYSAPMDVKLSALPGAEENDIDIVVQPDILVVCDPDKLDEDGCNGAPDWVIEILSPSTSYKDENEKLIIYEKFGVKEYWIIQPGSKMVFIYILNENGNYKKPEVAKNDEVVSSYAVPGVEIDLKKVF
ncbi:MAG: Uma2 family endonuclease [Spirochaetaceae bacterium]|nr:Uma2 family endonuclease [Spirochaetaceae bacterium]